MAKELKRATELQALIKEEIAKVRPREGAAGVTVIAVRDDHIDANWKVREVHNSTLSEQEVADIVAPLQRRYDLLLH